MYEYTTIVDLSKLNLSPIYARSFRLFLPLYGTHKALGIMNLFSILHRDNHNFIT